jgi:hypothetical protein
VTRIRPALAPTLAALSTLVLVAGCSAGYGAQSIQPYAPADGVIAERGNVRILDALVVAADGSNRGLLSMTVVNRGDRDDAITDISSPRASINLTGKRVLPAGRSVSFGAGTDPAATVEALSRAPGQEIVLVVRFARTQPITVRTVVVTPTGPYATVTPGPETPDDTDTSTESPSVSPTADAGADNTTSPSPSPSAS